MVFFLFFELTLVPVVLHHRRMGPRAAGLRGDQVLPLHLLGLGLPARRDSGAGLHPPVARPACSPSRCPRSPHTHLSSHDGDAALLGLHVRLCGQGADLPFPHLVARRLHRGPGRRVGRPRRASWPSSGPTGSSVSTSRCSRMPRRTLAPLILTLAVIGILYGAIVACAAARHEAAGGLLVVGPDGLHRRSARSR